MHKEQESIKQQTSAIILNSHVYGWHIFTCLFCTTGQKLSTKNWNGCFKLLQLILLFSLRYRETKPAVKRQKWHFLMADKNRLRSLKEDFSVWAGRCLFGMCVCLIASSCDDVWPTAASSLVNVRDLQGDGNKRTEHHLFIGWNENKISEHRWWCWQKLQLNVTYLFYFSCMCVLLYVLVCNFYCLNKWENKLNCFIHIFFSL